MDETEDKLEQYKRINVEAAQGRWKAARVVEPGSAVYYYQFSPSRAANASSSVDFVVSNNRVDTDNILPRAQRGYVAIQLELYTKNQLQDHCKSILSVVQGLLAQSTPDQTDRTKQTKYERNSKAPLRVQYQTCHYHRIHNHTIILKMH
jgi:hypothetical protein